jgi:DNA-binding transcriptional regulator YiaG
MPYVGKGTSNQDKVGEMQGGLLPTKGVPLLGGHPGRIREALGVKHSQLAKFLPISHICVIGWDMIWERDASRPESTWTNHDTSGCYMLIILV